MNILFDASNLFSTKGGGVYNYLVKFLPQLIEKSKGKDDFLSFFHLYWHKHENKTHEVLADQKIHRLRLPVKLLNKLWLTFKSPDLSRFYKDIDIFHSPHFSLPIMSKAKKILTVNDITYLKHPEFFAESGKTLNDYGYKKLLSVNIQRADQIIAISNYTKADLIDYYGIPEEKIKVVYIGCDIPDKINENLLQEGVGKFQLANTNYIYFPVGTLEPRKNIQSTIKAFKTATHGMNIKLVLSGVGATSWLPELKDPDIMLVRWETDLERNALYQGALFVLYPSLYEGFGMPVVEAMGNGKAVLTSNTTSLKEIAVGFAHTVNPNDQEEISEGISKLLEDDTYRRSLEKKSIIRSKDFTWKQMADETFNIYRDCK